MFLSKKKKKKKKMRSSFSFIRTFIFKTPQLVVSLFFCLFVFVLTFCIVYMCVSKEKKKRR